LVLALLGCRGQADQAGDSPNLSENLETADLNAADFGGVDINASNMNADAISSSDEAPSAGDPVPTQNSAGAALSIIQDAGHNCSSVIAVRHLQDSALATCDDGEEYRISRVNVGGKTTTLAMKCSAVEAAGVPCT
jgi:hypothetical protein